ncbi:MAG: hypothetical protein ACKOGI_07345 [Vulcanococcus sp.]
MLLALLAVIATGWALWTLARLLLAAAALLVLPRTLSRSGRRADLLEALAAAPG